MNIYKATYTHKGWVGLCPIHIGNWQSDAPDIKATHGFLDLWLDLQFMVYDFLAFVFDNDNGWPIRITGKLESPITIISEVDC